MGMETKKKKMKAPTTTALLMIMIVFVSILTYIVPAGEYDRIEDKATGREIIEPNSFQFVEQSPVSVWGILASVFKGIVEAADIIAFVLVVGGVFGVIIKSEAIHAGLAKLINKLHGRESIFIIVVMTAFAIGGATFGMAEETLPFVAVVIAASIAMGYDRIVAVSIVVVGVYAGYSAGPLNPFNVGIAQGIAELPLFSGIGLRTVLMVGGLIIAVHHTVRYAKKVKADPAKSLVADEAKIDTDDSLLQDNQMTKQHKLILGVLFLALIALVFGVLQYGWYLAEISALMMLMGIIAGLIAFKGSFNQFTDEFMKGAADMTAAALIIGLSRAILVVMDEGQIMDTIVYAISVPLSTLNSIMAAWGMYASQGLINFIIPSSTDRLQLLCQSWHL